MFLHLKRISTELIITTYQCFFTSCFDRIPISFSAMPDIDALSDGGFCEMGTYPGIAVPETGVPPSALASALRHLNPAEVQRRRNLLGEINE